MSMILELYRGTEEQLRAHLAECAKVLEEPAREPKIPGPIGLFFGILWGKIRGRPMRLSLGPTYSFPQYPESKTLDIDKAWHGLHFLFTGEEGEAALPAGFLLSGQVLEEYGDVGYGPAYMHDAAMVKQISEFLNGLTEKELRSRFAPDKMENIYPSIWDRDPAEDDTLQYLLDYFPDLKEFFEKARLDKEIVTISLC